MSSGVDQIKQLGTGAKSNEERNIPWSQQVDEASCESLSANEDNSAQTPLKFQYPPFNAKENQNTSWNNYKSRKNGNSDISKKYGRSGYHNSKREDNQINVWQAQNSKRTISENSSSSYNRDNRERLVNPGSYDFGSQSNNVEHKKVVVPQNVATPKKTTWALIASQPAKSTSKTILTSSTQKKKGPGMPPPPMIPGKHDLDATAWDVPTNNPPPVPSPPPPIDLSQNDFQVDLSQNHENENLRRENSRPTDLMKDSYGRPRYPPNGHSRKSWSNTHSMNNISNKQTISGGPNHQRRNENVRRPHYTGVRNDQDKSQGSHLRNENSNRNNDNLNVSDGSASEPPPEAVLEELKDKNNYNPTELDLEKAANARFFVIKSYSEDDIHRSIKYEIWCSTDHGNKRLDDAFQERKREGGTILLFFSVNGSGHFCGVAQMMTSVDYNSTSSVWSQDKWKGKFKVKWIYVKDVPNSKLRHIRLENNENKSVTNSRDTQEVPNAKGIEVLEILHSYKHATSIFDDFYHYEKKQVEEGSTKKVIAPDQQNLGRGMSPNGRNYQRGMDDRDFDRDNRGPSKYYNNAAGHNFRDRNRGGFQQYYDHRDPNEYLSRHSQKYDSNRREKDKMPPKQINREREYIEDHLRNGLHFRPDSKNIQKDNEFEDRT